MRFSIIIPIYNVEKYLKECISSILDQSFQDFELICIDDGSTDKSLEILKSYNDPRIKILDQKNSGQSVARNNGLKIALGEFIWFVDSDDKIAQESLKKLDGYIKENNKVDSIFFNAEIFFENNELKNRGWFSYQRLNYGLMTILDFFEKEYRGSHFFVSPCMYIFKREKYKNVSFMEGIIHEDNPFIIELIWTDINSYCLTVNEKFFLRRIRPNSVMTSKKSVKNFDGYNVAIEKLLNYANNNNINNKYLFNFIANLGVANCSVALTLQKSFIKKYFRQRISNYSKIPNISLKQKFIFLLPEIILIYKILRKIVGKK